MGLRVVFGGTVGGIRSVKLGNNCAWRLGVQFFIED